MTSIHGNGRTWWKLQKVALLVGYLAVTAASLSAYRSPATGYEESIYTATPLLFWVGTGAALAVSVGVSVRSYDSLLGPVALLLAVVSAVSLFALPVVRGYFFYGHGDPLTHLGLARDLRDNSLAVTDLIYPGNHVLSVVLSNILGIDIRHAMQLVAILLKLTFVLFVPLSLYALYRDWKILFIGAYSAILLLPLNSLATHEHFHVFSLTALFSPVALYFVFKHTFYDQGDDDLPYNLTPVSLLSPIPLTATVLFHPQIAVGLFVTFVAFVVVHFAYRLRTPDHYMTQLRGVYGQFLFFGTVLIVWIVQFDHAFRVFDLIVSGIEGILVGTGEAVPSAQAQGESAASLGINVAVLGLRLFGVSMVFTLIAGGLILRHVVGADRETKTEGAVRYLTAGGIALFSLMIFHLVGDVSVYLFRFLGFGMVVVTLLAVIALYTLSTVPVSGPFAVLRRPVVFVGTLVVLAAAVSIVFASPYVFLPNEHVTEAEYRGYESMFDQRDANVSVTGIRTSGSRFADAHQLGNRSHSDPPTGEQFDQPLPEVYQSDQLLTVSRYDRIRELEVFQGLRYSASGFARLETTPHIHRVQSNGDTTVYYIDAE